MAADSVAPQTTTNANNAVRFIFLLLPVCCMSSSVAYKPSKEKLLACKFDQDKNVKVLFNNNEISQSELTVNLQSGPRSSGLCGRDIPVTGVQYGTSLPKFKDNPQQKI